MRIFDRLCLLLIAGALLGSGASAAPSFRSADEALKQGIGAYKGGFYELAVPALEYAAAEDAFFAHYYLARIYSDNSSSQTDHGKAYLLFQRIADEYSDVDPDDDPRAAYVGKSLTELAGYLRVGLPQIGLRPDLLRAAQYYRFAALFFRDEDAQFELAKMQLKGEGVADDAANALHWLAVLSEKGHPGAQAFLADLLYRGHHTKKDTVKALALVTIAISNAPAQERVWIEDIHQNIFCGTSIGVRKTATGMVADWRNRFGRKIEASDRLGLAALNPEPIRTCADGEPVAPLEATSGSTTAASAVPAPAGTASIPAPSAAPVGITAPDGAGSALAPAAGIP